MSALALVWLLGGCGQVFELRVEIDLPLEAVEAFSPRWPLAITTSRKGELLVRNVWCAPTGDTQVVHVWQQRSGCRIPEALLVRVEEATLADELGCDVDAPVASVTPLEPPLELYWEPDETTLCEEDGGVSSLVVQVGLPR